MLFCDMLIHVKDCLNLSFTCLNFKGISMCCQAGRHALRHTNSLKSGDSQGFRDSENVGTQVVFQVTVPSEGSVVQI